MWSFLYHTRPVLWQTGYKVQEGEGRWAGKIYFMKACSMGSYLSLMRVGDFTFYPKNWVGHVLFCKNIRVGHIKLAFIKMNLSCPTSPLRTLWPVPDYLIFSIKRPRRLFQNRQFWPGYFWARPLFGIRCLLMKGDFQPFFQVDLLLPILGNLRAVCQC